MSGKSRRGGEDRMLRIWRNKSLICSVRGVQEGRGGQNAGGSGDISPIYVVSGESRRGGEDRMLEDLEKQVLNIYENCVGTNEVQ